MLIDGRSGAGKSTLARMLVETWPLADAPQVVALDSLYPGWDGLDAGVARAVHDILRPHAAGRIGVWRRWDWELHADAEQHTVHPRLGLVLEGCGAIDATTARLGQVRVWVDSPDVARKDRALRRDGDGFRAQWDRWAAQEERHIRRDDPLKLATLRVRVP